MKTVYKVSRKEPGAGFFSNWFWLLGCVCMYQSEGKTVMIDTISQGNLYNSKNIFKLKKKGYWDEVFQLNEFSDEYVEVVSDEYPSEFVPKKLSGDDIVFNVKSLETFRAAMKTHASLRVDVEKKINAKYLNVDFSKTLGIHYRAADKNSERVDHKMNQSFDNYLLKAAELIQKNNYQNVFLATDNDYAIRKCRTILSEKVIYSGANRVRNQYAARGVHDSRFNKIIGYFSDINLKNAFDVVEDALILSRCDSMICGYSNISDAAICLREEGYKDLILIGNGEINFE
jgi:hypothetical protein